MVWDHLIYSIMILMGLATLTGIVAQIIVGFIRFIKRRVFP